MFETCANAHTKLLVDVPTDRESGLKCTLAQVNRRVYFIEATKLLVMHTTKAKLDTIVP